MDDRTCSQYGGEVGAPARGCMSAFWVIPPKDFRPASCESVNTNDLGDEWGVRWSVAVATSERRFAIRYVEIPEVHIPPVRPDRVSSREEW